jgi:hypothetical protein
MGQCVLRVAYSVTRNGRDIVAVERYRIQQEDDEVPSRDEQEEEGERFVAWVLRRFGFGERIGPGRLS